METRIDEIADRIYRLSTFVPEVAPPAGFTFNQFLIDADEPLLFHAGMRPLFPSLREALARVIDPARLRWIGYSHVESDECGALEDWFAVAAEARPVHGQLGCALWLNDMSSRPPRQLADGERLELGGRTVRFLSTPDVPHNADAGLMLEERTGTLFCSDLFAHVGEVAPTTGDDVLEPAIEADRHFPFTPVTPSTAPKLRRLAALRPTTLAIMHGASFQGDGAAMLEGLARYYEARLKAEA